VLRLFWLGVIEASRPELCPSFFQLDFAPTILGFLCRDDTPSPLDPATPGSLRRDNTLSLAPPTLESPRRGDTSPFTPEIMGVLSDGSSPPLIPEISGILGRDDTSPWGHLPPEIPRALRRGDTPHTPPFPAYVSRHLARPPPTLSFPEPSILANTHPATPAPPMSPTRQAPFSDSTPHHQDIAQAQSGSMPRTTVFSMAHMSSRPAMQRDPRPFALRWSYRAYPSVFTTFRRIMHND